MLQSFSRLHWEQALAHAALKDECYCLPDSCMLSVRFSGSNGSCWPDGAGRGAGNGRGSIAASPAREPAQSGTVPDGQAMGRQQDFTGI